MTYGLRLDAMETAGKVRLRAEQRAWIADRSAQCQVVPHPGTRDWLGAVADDRHQTECVVRVTRERLDALRADPRREYDLVQTVRESNDEIVFSVRVHPRLPRFGFQVVWQTAGPHRSTTAGR